MADSEPASRSETPARVRFQTGPKGVLLVLGSIMIVSVVLLVVRAISLTPEALFPVDKTNTFLPVFAADYLFWGLAAVWFFSVIFTGVVLFRWFIGPPEKLVHFLLLKSRKQEPLRAHGIPGNWRPWFNIVSTVFNRMEALAREAEKTSAELQEKVNLIRRFSWVYERNEELTAEVEKKNRELEIAVEKYREAAEELKRHRDHLEERVSERTQELSEANEKLKAMIEQANEMAEKANAANLAKTHFLANMSHEIRTPLNAIIGFTDMMLETKLDEDQFDYVTTTRKSSEALFELLNNILDFSKIEAGELDLERVDFDPELLVFDICDLIRPKTKGKPVEVICRIADDVPQTVKGDPGRFRQVLTNLMGNAAKFTRSGEIALFLGVDKEAADRVKLHVTVRDTGIGIPEEKLNVIFDPFQQADESMTREYGGTGLGLSISRRIARLMGGDVWAESRVGAGSTFHCTAWTELSRQPAEKRRPPASLDGKRVLVMDGNPLHLDFLSEGLKSAGMEVSGVNTGDDAVRAFEESIAGRKPIHLGILDIQVSDANGYAMASTLRSLGGAASRVPLIAVSASLEREGQKCRRAGFNAFLSKPFPLSRLFQVAERLFSGENEALSGEGLITRHSVREAAKRSVRILLVEDNLVNQRLAKTMLTKAGYQVEIAENGRVALEKFTAAPRALDLILMDVQMPEMDGIQATQEIRKAESFLADAKDRRIPIIALTAHAMKGDREMCLEAGMDDYITKPIKREVVLEILKQWIAGIDLSVGPA